MGEGPPPRPEVATWVERVRGGTRSDLARAITLVESSRADHRELTQELLVQLAPYAGKATRIGISGVPGVGKSTFVDGFGSMLTARGHRVAVLAVDPSSTRTGGSILGDKTRMARLAVDPHAFVRPSPTGGRLGGVARATRETMVLVEAAGYDVVLVETVGVGQSEVAVADMVDTFLLLALGRTGDQLQAIKKGILELADVIAVNKADGEGAIEAGVTARDLTGAMRMMRSADPAASSWRVPVLTCSGLTGAGLEDVWDAVQRHQQAVSESGSLQERRSRQHVEWMWSLVSDQLLAALHAIPPSGRSCPGPRPRYGVASSPPPPRRSGCSTSSSASSPPPAERRSAQARTVVTGMEESAGRSSREGVRPRATICAPSAATIAPLSVHRPGRGTRSRIPAASHRSCAIARSRLLAATPPPMRRSSTPCSWQASTALRVSTSVTASWKLAATSATGTGSPDRSRASTQRATEVFRPENEKSNRCRSMSLRDVRPRGKSIATELPSRAMRSTCGPPGNGSPSTRATLSNASPAASSMVLPSERTSSVTSGTSSRLEWPPDTSIASVGSGERAVLDDVHRDVGGQVVHAVQRDAERDGERLRRGDTDEQGPGQAGAGGDGDRVEVGEPHPGLAAGALDRGHHRLEVGPAGHLGHHPAEPGVLLDAAGHGVDQQLLAADDPDTGLVAGGLDAEHQGPVVHQLTSFRSSRMMWASTSPGW